MLKCEQLKATNAENIISLVDDALRLLGEGCSRDDVLVMVTDGARYMLKAGRKLKELYPNLVHVTCLAHAMHLVAETIRDKFSDLNNFIAWTKSIFLKCPGRVQLLRNIAPDIPLPPAPIITRWGTWLKAVDYYATHFEIIISVTWKSFFV